MTATLKKSGRIKECSDNLALGTPLAVGCRNWELCVAEGHGGTHRGTLDGGPLFETLTSHSIRESRT
ncbi:MAG TPA: hypothetical protein DCG12_13320 [Planctomycetaceae bacterium]|nr:hypothetical protein [Planctomycetaceae bacterium]